jgi:hypothetical protein
LTLQYNQYHVQLEIHFILVIIFFLLFSIAIPLYSLAILVGKRFSNLYAVAGLISLTVGIILFIDPAGPFGAFLQKIIEYAYFGWVLLIINLNRLQLKNKYT